MMDFNFSYSGAPDESVAVMFAAIWIVVMLVCGAVGIAVYIFRSLAVYTVAKRRGLPVEDVAPAALLRAAREPKEEVAS